MNNFSRLANFMWDIAGLLRVDYKQAKSGKVILSFTILRRLNSMLEPNKAKVFAKILAPIERTQTKKIFLQEYRTAFINESVAGKR